MTATHMHICGIDVIMRCTKQDPRLLNSRLVGCTVSPLALAAWQDGTVENLSICALCVQCSTEHVCTFINSRAIIQLTAAHGLVTFTACDSKLLVARTAVITVHTPIPHADSCMHAHTQAPRRAQMQLSLTQGHWLLLDRTWQQMICVCCRDNINCNWVSKR